MGSKEGKDRRKIRDIVRGRLRFLWGKVDISTEDGDKIFVPAARLNGQMTNDRLGRMPLTRRGKRYE